jgi:hypothetical protein
MDFDVELMARTAERMSKTLGDEFESLVHSHGIHFSRSVLGNVGCYLLTALLASEEDEGMRLLKLLTIVEVLSVNVKAELASAEAEEIIERIKKGSKC